MVDNGRLICEACTHEGPTGQFREVSESAIVDYGGNEYARVSTAKEAREKLARLRINAKLAAVSVGRYIDDQNQDDVFCGYWLEG